MEKHDISFSSFQNLTELKEKILITINDISTD
jgi:hypothetical protein